jgi:3-oxoacyl-[acyl-carrier protein] reductase
MDKTIIVTGASQGIGRGICTGLRLAGTNILAVDIKPAKLETITEKDSSNKWFESLHFIEADVTSKKDCKRIVEKAFELFGGIDGIVNCAAPSRGRNLTRSMSLEEWPKHQKLIIEAPILLAEKASKYLKKSSCGSIVNISSTLGYFIAQDQASASYHVTKAGLEQLTRWLAVRLGEYGVRVNAIAPGLVDREGGPMLSDNPKFANLIKDITPLKRAGTYKDITNLVAFLCSEKASYITGQVIVIDGGLGVVEIFGGALRALGNSEHRLAKNFQK